MLRVILTIVQVFAAFSIVGLVLLQRGKGADAGAGFGAGASGTVFGARGAGTALSHATAIFAAVFMVNSLLLTYVGTRAVAAPPKSILDTIGDKTGKPAPNATGTVAPGTAPGAATAPAAPGPADSSAPTSTPPATGDATATAAPAAISTQAPAATPSPAPAQSSPAGTVPNSAPPNGAAVPAPK